MCNPYSFHRSLMRACRAILFAALFLALTFTIRYSRQTHASASSICKKPFPAPRTGKEGFASFKNSFKKEKDVIAKKEVKIKKMLDDLNKQSFVLDPKLKKKKEDNFRKQKVAFERYVEDQNAAFAKKEKEMTQQLLDADGGSDQKAR